MNKTLLSVSMIAAVGAAVVASPSARAADGKITFTGTVTDVTCTVTAGPGATGSNGDFTVALDSVNKTALDTAGDRAGDKPFSLVIGGSGQTGCTDGKVVKLKFEPTQSPVDAATGRLTNSGTAQKVQVGLLNKNKQDINLNDGTNNIGETIADNTATLTYYAQYYAPSTGVTAGTVNTHVMYSLSYN